MLDTDRWFQDQLCKLQERTPAAARLPVTSVGEVLRAPPGQMPWRMMVASGVLASLLGVFVGEAAIGPMRADQPFGLTPSPAAFQAAALPSINGKGSTSPRGDHRTVVVAGARP